jgi:hypothetical protein
MLAPPFGGLHRILDVEDFNPTFRLMSVSWRTSSAAFARSSLDERMVMTVVPIAWECFSAAA